MPPARTPLPGLPPPPRVGSALPACDEGVGVAQSDDHAPNHGVRPEDIAEIWVPGSFELPLAAKRLAESGAFSGIVALGVVMRGETAHFDYVAGEASSGLARVAWETGVPVGFALLTLDDAEQAIHRAGGKAGNKGTEAALAALEMANLLRDLPAFARKFRR
ncbi:MAG: 6,7-dimethyl-8-ribityllumazine synthase [Brockia lithotrophica]|nr:6,7-dimethyl-8-ribityllumazine synthase [Brockia lithotrophica]